MLENIIGIALLVMAVFLIVAVLMQSSKNHRLSGTIAGGAETFFGKTKGKSMDAVLSKITTVVAVLFIVLVIALYVIMSNPTPAANVTPTDGEVAPVTEGEAPVADAEAPVADAEAPVADAEAPVADAEAPVADAEAPVADAEAPVADAEAPVAE